MARTNVKEARRTVRVVIFVTLFHPYNRESVDKKREERSTMKEKLKVKRVNGAERITGLFNHVESVLAEAEQAVRKLGRKSTRRYSTIIVTLTTKQVLPKGRRKCKASRPPLKSREISRRTSAVEILSFLLRWAEA